VAKNPANAKKKVVVRIGAFRIADIEHSLGTGGIANRGRVGVKTEKRSPRNGTEESYDANGPAGGGF